MSYSIIWSTVPYFLRRGWIKLMSNMFSEMCNQFSSINEWSNRIRSALVALRVRTLSGPSPLIHLLFQYPLPRLCANVDVSLRNSIYRANDAKSLSYSTRESVHLFLLMRCDRRQVFLLDSLVPRALHVARFFFRISHTSARDRNPDMYRQSPYVIYFSKSSCVLYFPE